MKVSKKGVCLHHKATTKQKSMEINVPKSTKLSRIKELVVLNKRNGIKQTQKELRSLSYDQLNKLLVAGYDKAFGTGFKMTFK